MKSKNDPLLIGYAVFDKFENEIYHCLFPDPSDRMGAYVWIKDFECVDEYTKSYNADSVRRYRGKDESIKERLSKRYKTVKVFEVTRE